MKTNRLCLLALVASIGALIAFIPTQTKVQQKPIKPKKEEITRWEGEGGNF